MRQVSLLENDRCRSVPKQGQGLPVFGANALAGDFCSDHQNPFDIWQLKLVSGQGKCGHETQTRGVDVEGVAVRLVSTFHGRQRQRSLARDDLGKSAPRSDEDIDVIQGEGSRVEGLLGSLRSHDGQRLMRDLVSHVHAAVLHAPPRWQAVFLFDGCRGHRLRQVLSRAQNATRTRNG